MPLQKVIVFMGSQRDYEFASRIQKFLEEENLGVECEYLVASAHRTPEMLLSEVEKYEKMGAQLVFITVAGLSDALSGVVAGASTYPVIACPPDSEKFGWAKIFSSVMTPRGVAVAFVPKPENAALSAAKILALSDKTLHKTIRTYLQALRKGAWTSSRSKAKN